MDVELPPWLDDVFLESVLQGGMGHAPLTVKKFSATLAVVEGNNYLARIYRVKIKYNIENEDKYITVIIKAPLTKGAISDMLGECDVYGKEQQVYMDLLPVLSSYIECPFSPKVFDNPLNNKALILTDLKELGFEMCDKFKQLDFPHCERVFKTLAKFHAASVVCKRDRPDIIEVAGKEICYIQNGRYENVMRPWIDGGLKSVIEVIQENGLNKVSEAFILSRVDKVADSAIRLCKPKTSGLNLLNHGDLWCNNILFKHTKSGDISDIRFIDYQIVKYTSPALDLINFIWTSASEQVRENDVHELLEIYRNTLNSTLEELNCEERLLAEELFEDIKDAVDWILLIICTLLPLVFCVKDDAMELGEGNSADFQDKYFRKLCKGKQFLTKLSAVLDHLQTWLAYYK